jgi:hypothetical protein
VIVLLYGVYAPLVGSLNGRRRFLEQAGLDIGYGALRTAGLVGGEFAFAKLGAMGFDAVALRKYPQVERIDHVHHAGNSSGIVDGATALLIGSEAAGRSHGLTPRARIVAVALSGADPTIMLTGPMPATRKALAKAGMTVDQIDLFEVNEAFHMCLLELAQNKWRDQMVADLRKVMKLNRHNSLFKTGRIKESLNEHQAIMAALNAKDPVATAARMREHFANGLMAASASPI